MAACPTESCDQEETFQKSWERFYVSLRYDKNRSEDGCGLMWCASCTEASDRKFKPVPAPCGDHRCLQERKQLRKELEKGRKNLIAYIGLECITESLFGSEFFQKISPFKDEERKETGDWDSQQENCVLCAVRQEAVAESIANHQAYLDRLEDRGNHLSHRDRVLKAEQWLAQSAAVSEGLDPVDGDQKQPLDLSKAALLAAAASREVGEAENGEDLAQSALRVPSVSVHRPTANSSSNNKKGTNMRVSRGYGSASYTQDDLRLALQEVRRGKVGTRRAAMLYGIPRSTIRNHLNRHSFLCEDEDESSQDSKAGTKRSAKSSKVQNGTDEDETADEFDPVTKLRSFLRNRNEAEKTTPAGLESSLSQHLIKELALNYTRLSKTKTLDVDSLRQKSLSASKNSKNQERVESDFTLPEYIFHVLIQRHLESEKKRVLDKSNPLKPALRQPAAQPNVDLKVPLYKPLNVSTDTQNSDMDNNGSSWSVKPDPDALPGLDWKSQLDNMSDSRSSSPFSEKRYSSQDASNMNKRPKRGRYRCYDRDALMQAVGAVQRGEMTVTRAGNVFGVPHSTLEYKVKERHLKRSPKKQAPKVSKSEAPRTESRQSTSTPTYSALNMYDASHISPFAMATRPFESFAERLRAMSEKQAMQNLYGYLLKQSLESSPGVGVVMQDLGQMHSQLSAQQQASLKDSYPGMEDQIPLLTNPALNPLLLGKQQWVWALHPAAAAAYQQTYKEALQQQQVLYGMQQDKAATAAAAAAAGLGNASVSDAINRLVEAHIYDSLYGKSEGSTNKSASNPPSESGEPSTSGESKQVSKRPSEPDDSKQASKRPSEPDDSKEDEEEETKESESKKPKKEEESEEADE